jgi:hypothetical protein
MGVSNFPNVIIGRPLKIISHWLTPCNVNYRKLSFYFQLKYFKNMIIYELLNTASPNYCQ